MNRVIFFLTVLLLYLIFTKNPELGFFILIAAGFYYYFKNRKGSLYFSQIRFYEGVLERLDIQNQLFLQLIEHIENTPYNSHNSSPSLPNEGFPPSPPPSFSYEDYKELPTHGDLS